MLAKTERGPEQGVTAALSCNRAFLFRWLGPRYNPQAGPPHQRAIALGRRGALLTAVAPSPQSGPLC